MDVVVSPKVEAQQSKWESPFCCSVSYWRYRITVYISVMELLTGVPEANTTPRPPVTSSRYLHFMNMSEPRWASEVESPATLHILVYRKRF